MATKKTKKTVKTKKQTSKKTKPVAKKVSKKIVKKVSKEKVIAKKSPAPKKLSSKERAVEAEVKTKRLILKGKERGFVTYDEILKEFPHVEEDILFLDDLYEKFTVAGIDILEGGGYWMIIQMRDFCLKNINTAKGQKVHMIQSKCI